MIDYVLNLVEPLKGVISDCAYDRIICCLVVGFELGAFAGICYCTAWLLRSLFGGRYK